MESAKQVRLRTRCDLDPGWSQPWGQRRSPFDPSSRARFAARVDPRVILQIKHLRAHDAGMTPPRRACDVYAALLLAHDPDAESRATRMIIRKLRLRRGWSQQQLSEISGTSLRTIQRVEAGATPSLETLKSLAAVLEVSIEELGAPDMTSTEDRVSPQEALAMKQVDDLRGFYIHATIYLVVCAVITIILWARSPEHLWTGLFVWLGWGAGLLIHAVGTFLLDGSWERRQVERKLGRPL